MLIEQPGALGHEDEVAEHEGGLAARQVEYVEAPFASKVLDANLQISALQAQLAAANQAAAANAAKNVAPAPTPGK